MRKGTQRAWGIITLTGLAGIIVCSIVNLAVSGSLSWALYPISSIGLAWLITSAFMLAKGFRLQAALFSMTIGILPFLMLLDRLSPNPGWMWPIAFPIAAASLCLLWLALILYRHTPINNWFCTGIVILGSVCLNATIEYTLNRYYHTSTAIINPINVIACVGLAAVCFLLGLAGRKRRRAA